MPAAGRTVLDVVRLSTAHLARRGSSSPRLDAELLLAHALAVRRLDLYLQHDRPLADVELEAARDAVRRRGRGEPVAYITGVREFYGRAFHVSPAVLVPRPETETLVTVTLACLRERGGDAATVADLGAGSGCVAVTLAAEAASISVVAGDVSPEALDVARGNVKRHGLDGRVQLAAGDWASALADPVDVVVSNPPYVTSAELEAAMPDVRDFEPRLALDGGADGLDAYRGLLASLDHRLAPGATLVLEVDPRRAGQVADLVRQALPGSRTAVHQDLGRRDRVVVASLP